MIHDFTAADLTVKSLGPCRIDSPLRPLLDRPYDSVYCIRLAHNAVHAAMSGKTEMVVGRWHSRFVHVPIPMAVRERYRVDPSGDLWTTVLEATGQPPEFR